MVHALSAAVATERRAADPQGRRLREAMRCVPAPGQAWHSTAEVLAEQGRGRCKRSPSSAQTSCDRATASVMNTSLSAAYCSLRRRASRAMAWQYSGSGVERSASPAGGPGRGKVGGGSRHGGAPSGGGLPLA